MAATKKTTAAAPRVASDLAFLCRALKAPALAGSVGRLADRARDEGWTHEEFLAACLEREVASRQTHGGDARIRAARFPSVKTIEDFDFAHQRSVNRDAISHLAALDFVAERSNVVFLGPPTRFGPGRLRPWVPGRTVSRPERARPGSWLAVGR